MVDHRCLHEEDFGKLKAKTDRADKELFGNGGKGLSKDVLILKTEFKEMNEDVSKLATSYSALARADSNREAVKKALGKSFVIGCSILAAGGTLVAIISYFN